MEADALHELTPAYALDALSGEEERAYEEHLARCSACQEELAAFTQAASSLAYAVEAPAPPDALRGRILEQARAERTNVVPFRRRLSAVSWAAAAVATAAAVGFGIWAASLNHSLDRERAKRESVYAIVSDPQARHVPVSGEKGTLIVSNTGEAALAFARLAPAPSGKTYEAWVFENGKPKPAGVFTGGSPAVFRLTRSVPAGGQVAVTIERRGGVDQPQGSPVATARA